MNSPTSRGSILGPEIEKRLAQLGLSRREFARRADIGRQTLQNIIHDPEHRISDRTFAALDKGLKWEAGVAKSFHHGNQKARETAMPVDERINTYILQILQRLGEMSIDQLEREVLILEEESHLAVDSPTSRLIDRQIRKLVASLLSPDNGDGDEKRQTSDPPKNERGRQEGLTAGD